MFAASKSGSAATPSDADFEYVTLLLPGNGTNGAQNNTFLDGSTNNFTITRNGNTTQGTFSPYGSNWANYFDGVSGTRLSIADNTALNPGTGDFCIEGWVYSSKDWAAYGGAFATLFGKGSGIPTGTYGIGVYLNNVYVTLNGTNYAGTTSLSQNVWYHVAVTRSGSTVRVFLNGNLEVSATNSSDLTSTAAFAIADRPASDPYGQYPFNGYISNVRLVKGSAVYTAAFTPPTVPLTAITNTSLLTCQSNRFVDNSTNAFAITVSGGSSVQRFSPFSPTAAYTAAIIGGSGYFDGSGDSLSSTTNFEASTSTSTFTIEGWVYPTTFSTLINIIGGMAVSSGDAKTIAAEVNTSGQVALYWFDGSIKRCTGNTVMQLYAWNYFAIVVNSNAISIYVNKTTADTLSGTTTLTNRTVLQGLGVGAYYNNNSPAYYFNGYFANLRVSTVARTISSVPSAPLENDANVRWLLNFTNAGIIDNAMMSDLETLGSAQISTTQSKFGGASIYFNGTDSYLTCIGAPLYKFNNGNFTIECWLRINSLTGGVIIDFRPNSTNGDYPLLYMSGSSILFYVNGTKITSSAVTTGAWFHFALCRSGSSTKMFFDGTQTGSTYTDSVNYLVGAKIGIGSSTFAFGTSLLDGYIDDFRITNGVARYTANFTPPSAPFPTR